MRISRVGNWPVSSRTSNGLTLLELMAALVILGLLVALVPPAVDGIGPRWRLRATARQVAATAQWARNAAAVQGSPVEVFYDVPEGSHWVRVGDDTEAFHTLPRDVRFEWVKFGDIQVAGDVAVCKAFPDGTLDAHEVMLRNEKGMRIRISFDRLTGEPTYEYASDKAY